MDGSQFLEQAMNTQRSVASFMLRFTQDLWQDENGDPQVQWRGRINHVQGGEELPFTDFSEALTFIQKQLQDLTLQAFPAADPEVREKALKESFKLWERFAAGYAELVVKAMENAFRQSQEIRSQVGDAWMKSFKLWMPPGFQTGQSEVRAPQPPADLIQLVDNLSEQVRALSQKVEDLESKER